MGDAVKKTISLPPDLAEDAERVAKEEGKSLSAVIQDALRLSKASMASRRVEGDAGILECPGAGEGAPQGGRSRPVPTLPMRVVFDSDVLLAALLFPGGRAAAAVENVLGGKDDLVLSPPILRGILSVLARKFSRDREEFRRLAVVLAEIGEIVDPFRRLTAFRDGPDNRIQECAVEGRADVIVTGDKAILALGEYGGIRLNTLAEYLDRRGRKAR